MRFEIGWLEEKTTSTGKRKYNVTLKQEGGPETTGVTIWEDFPRFSDLKAGDTVEGELVPAKDPKWGPTLYPPKEQRAAGPGRSAGAITKAQDRKAEHIQRAQENKEESIKISSTMRDAVLITVAMMAQTPGRTWTKDEVKGSVVNCRKWLWDHWDDPITLPYPPFEDAPKVEPEEDDGFGGM